MATPKCSKCGASVLSATNNCPRRVCKKCQDKRIKQYAQAHRKLYAKATMLWRERNSDKLPAMRRKYSLKHLYNTAPEVIDAKAKTQGHKCMICSKKHKLVVDHNHATGKLRDLLCHHCNRMLGHALEDPTTLRMAADYLERHATGAAFPVDKANLALVNT